MALKEHGGYPEICSAGRCRDNKYHLLIRFNNIFHIFEGFLYNIINILTKLLQILKPALLKYIKI